MDGGPRRRRLGEADKKRVAAGQAWRCALCSLLLPSTYQVDHVVPFAAGGGEDDTNLQALCPNCHADKTQREHGRLLSVREHERASGDNASALCWHCEAVYSLHFEHRCEEVA